MGYVIDALTSSPPTRVINTKGEGLLSPREEQVVNLVAEGIGNREVAQQLGHKREHGEEVAAAGLRQAGRLESSRAGLVRTHAPGRGNKLSPRAKAAVAFVAGRRLSRVDAD